MSTSSDLPLKQKTYLRSLAVRFRFGNFSTGYKSEREICILRYVTRVFNSPEIATRIFDQVFLPHISLFKLPHVLRYLRGTDSITFGGKKLLRSMVPSVFFGSN
jgi:hypothetical protein